MAGESESPPVPDPTVLTTEQLLREIGTLKELFDTALEGHNMVNIQRFENVATQLGLVERQRVEQKEDTKAAVDAALAAAKEAVKEQTTASQLSIGKSEASTKEQLSQLSTTFTTAQQALTQAIVVLTTRVERIENQRSAIAEQRNDTRGGAGVIFGAIGTVVGVIGLIVTVVVLSLGG